MRMRFTSETTSAGVSERAFDLGDIPGVLWTPAEAPDTCPLVLLGHGGGMHARTPGLAARARRFVTAHGFAVAAVDAPGHGERPRTRRDEEFAAGVRERLATGRPLGSELAEYSGGLAARAVPEWRAVLDALRDSEHVGAAGPVGYWGLSMGSAIGIPLVAAEPRIGAAVFGLAGHTSLMEAAMRITVPIGFLVQWDDELIPRDRALALFDAFGAKDKTLHANTGGHTGVPAFEVEDSGRFLARHLGGGPADFGPGSAPGRRPGV